MAKSTTSKKTSTTESNTNAAYSAKIEKALSPSRDNLSKYKPGEEVDQTLQTLDDTDGLLKLFTDSIKDIYWAENHLVKAIPKMANATSLGSLQTALQNHLEQTKTHVQRLEQVFELLGKTPQAKKCDAMEGLTKEGEGVIENTDVDTPSRDLGIIMACQKVEHYEISSYAGLIKLAHKLGLNDIAALLNETLLEEGDADELLGEIADTDVAATNTNDAGTL